jgi:signal transduction histidine kinase
MVAQSETKQEVTSIFRLLVIYRWLSLIPVGLAVGLDSQRLHWVVPVALAVVINGLITLFPARLNALLQKYPHLLWIDLGLCAILFVQSGGWNTPFYLYAFSPLLAAAFFFRLRGALMAAGGIVALYALAGIASGEAGPALPQRIAAEVGFCLIAGAFGYATTLLGRSENARRDLEVIHDLTLSLQRAVDVGEVEQQVLMAVTDRLGFRSAAIALVDQDAHEIGSWIGKSNSSSEFRREKSPTTTPLLSSMDYMTSAILDGSPRMASHEEIGGLPSIHSMLDSDQYHVFPMLLRGHAVGILVVGSDSEEDRSRKESLEAVANQAAVAVGATMLCIDRAQRLAVQEERIRIAREIHDTVSQSLFGMTYALDACGKLLPEYPDQVKEEIRQVTSLAQVARKQLRDSIMDIWPSELTSEGFVADLKKFASTHCKNEDLEVQVKLTGNLQYLSSGARRGLYRIAQEAINNVARHASASEAEVCANVSPQGAYMLVRDNGRGFNVTDALAREQDREHFGLRGIQERSASLGGQVEVVSGLGDGTLVLVTLPVDGAHESWTQSES